MSKSSLIILVITFFATLCLAIKYIFKKYIAKHQIPLHLITCTPITPKNTIIAFDLHDVIVNYNYTDIIKTFFASDKKLKLLLIMTNPLLWYDIIKLFYNNAVAEQYIIDLGQKYKSLESYIPLGIKIANCQIINKNVLEIIKNLKKQGYILNLFSNIGSIIFEDFKQKYPEILPYFDTIILPSRQNGYLRKPNARAFISYIKYIKKNTPQKQIIFIDDKIKNIKKAEQFDIIGILYKNANQLKKELKKLGILKENHDHRI